MNVVLFNVRAPPRMLEISFLRIYFESVLIGNLHLLGKKVAEIVVSCIFNYKTSKVSAYKKKLL